VEVRGIVRERWHLGRGGLGEEHSGIPLRDRADMQIGANQGEESELYYLHHPLHLFSAAFLLFVLVLPDVTSTIKAKCVWGIMGVALGVLGCGGRMIGTFLGECGGDRTGAGL
jgi:hypothetical protein